MSKALLLHEKSFLFDNTATSVYSMALYNRSLLITSSNDVVQKDIETGSVQRKFAAHFGQVQHIMVVNGSTMITTGWDDIIIFWDLVTGSIVRRIWLEASKTFPSSVYLKNDTMFLCGYDSRARIVNVATDVNTVAYAIVANDVTFFVGKSGRASSLGKYSIATRSLQSNYAGHDSSVLSLVLWNALLFSGSADTTIICWHENNSGIIRIYNGHTDAVRTLHIHNNYLYSGSDNYGIIKWNIDLGSIEAVFDKHHRNSVLCFASEEENLYSGSLDTTVIRWDSTSSTKMFSYFGRNIKLRSVVLWNNMIIAGGDNPALLIQAGLQNAISPVEIMSGHSNEGIGFLDLLGDTLFSGGVDATIRRFSLLNYSFIQVFYGHEDIVTSLVSEENSLFSGSLDLTIKRWNILSGLVLSEYVGHNAAVLCIQIGKELLYSGSSDTHLGVWNRETSSTITFIRCKFLPRFNCLDPNGVYALLRFGDSLVVGTYGLDILSFSTSDVTAKQSEPFICFSIVATQFRIYLGHADGIIRGRDPMTLHVLESFQGHTDHVMSLCLDDAGSIFSTGFDGSIKKWNMASRKVAFSYENRNGYVTALAAASEILYVGTREGVMNSFSINTAFFVRSAAYHRNSVTSLVYLDGVLYSSGTDGIVYGFSPTESSTPIVMYDSDTTPITNMNSNGSSRRFYSPLPLTSITASVETIFAGSKTGSIIAYNLTSFETVFSLEYHTSQVNYLLLSENFLYSSSNDKMITKWSLEQRLPAFVFQRLSATALGHLGPVNGLAVCGSTLFSAGSDLTTRIWNAITGRHEDVYFGATKSASSVICHNGSVFAGSEDFSVLMYAPSLPKNVETNPSSGAQTRTQRKGRTISIFQPYKSNSDNTITSLLIGGVLSAFFFISAVILAFLYSSKRLKTKQIGKHTSTTPELSVFSTDLQTVVNTVIGISKHAAFLVPYSNLASIKKLASGGGGEIFLARVINPFLNQKSGTMVIQKDRLPEMSEAQTVEKLVAFLNDLDPIPRSLIKQLTRKPETTMHKFMQRTKEDWKEIAGVTNGIDIFNYIHPDQGSLQPTVSSTNWHEGNTDWLFNFIILQKYFGWQFSPFISAVSSSSSFQLHKEKSALSEPRFGTTKLPLLAGQLEAAKAFHTSLGQPEGCYKGEGSLRKRRS
ncbi:hypothetical protein MP638_006869 [Amoeboaphelidium occidentale]|nr:hypothetical protein MP638_006869 [Amoeboaphelidium occidentale]